MCHSFLTFTCNYENVGMRESLRVTPLKKISFYKKATWKRDISTQEQRQALFKGWGAGI